MITHKMIRCLVRGGSFKIIGATVKEQKNCVYDVSGTIGHI